VAGDSETGSGASGVKRRCWEVPSWLKTVRLFESDRLLYCSSLRVMIVDENDTVYSMQQTEGSLLKDDLPDVTNSSGSAFSEGTLPLFNGISRNSACVYVDQGLTERVISAVDVRGRRAGGI
jgi:hypothetical protein